MNFEAFLLERFAWIFLSIWILTGGTPSPTCLEFVSLGCMMPHLSHLHRTSMISPGRLPVSIFPQNKIKKINKYKLIPISSSFIHHSSTSSPPFPHHFPRKRLSLWPLWPLCLGSAASVLLRLAQHAAARASRLWRLGAVEEPSSMHDVPCGVPKIRRQCHLMTVDCNGF